MAGTVVAGADLDLNGNQLLNAANLPGGDLRAEGSNSSGTPGTVVASIAAGTGKKLVGLTVFASQIVAANTQMTLTITFSDTTTLTATTVANTAETIMANNAGYIRTTAGAATAQGNTGSKAITAAKIATAGTGTSARIATIAALEVNQ